MHKFIPDFNLEGTVTKPRLSSSSSSSRVLIPCLSSAALQDDSYQPGRAYHSTHEDRHDFEILSDLFPDLGESSYENWD